MVLRPLYLRGIGGSNGVPRSTGNLNEAVRRKFHYNKNFLRVKEPAIHSSALALPPVFQVIKNAVCSRIAALLALTK
jgi:hypothetical protein